MIARANYLGFSLGGKVGWGVAASAQDRLDSIVLFGAEPETNEEVSEEFADLFRRGHGLGRSGDVADVADAAVGAGPATPK